MYDVVSLTEFSSTLKTNLALQEYQQEEYTSVSFQIYQKYD